MTGDLLKGWQNSMCAKAGGSCVPAPLGAEVAEMLRERGELPSPLLTLPRGQEVGTRALPHSWPTTPSSPDALAAPGVSRLLFAGLCHKEERQQSNYLQCLLEAGLLPKSTPCTARTYVAIPTPQIRSHAKRNKLGLQNAVTTETFTSLRSWPSFQVLSGNMISPRSSHVSRFQPAICKPLPAFHFSTQNHAESSPSARKLTDGKVKVRQLTKSSSRLGK